MFSRKVILRALVCALLAMVPFPERENQFYDLKLKVLSRTYGERPDSTVIIEIGEEEFEALRQRFGSPHRPGGGAGPWREKFEALRNQFFWDDGVYEAILTRILREEPRRLLVTFFFSDSLVILQGNPTLQRLARNGAVLWASQFDLDQKHMKPAPELTGTENYGFTNLYPDADGVVRRASLIQRNHISLPYRALLDGPKSVRTEMPLTEPFLIRYRGRSGHIPTCNVLALFDDRCDDLKGRFVILSPTGNIVAGASLYRSPLGYMSRGEALANVLLTARESEPVKPLSAYLIFFAVFGHALLLSQVVLRSTGRRQLFSALLLLAGEAALSLVLLRLFAWQMPIAPFVLVTLATYLSFLWLKFAQQESKRWQAEKKAQYLRELDELKSNFISLMSHDLKTPIAKVQALAERLTREARGLTDDQREILAAIQRSNDELGEYILSILNFQRIESQEIKLHKKSHDVNVLIEEVVARLAAFAHDRGVLITTQLEPMFAVTLDEQLIKQVLTNLLDNAIKYNKSGARVKVRSADLGKFVEVSVEDDGAGLDADQREMLFKKFSRAGSGERIKGTGLGLYLTKYFIELHGGEIRVESEPGQGTRFHFRLPISE